MGFQLTVQIKDGYSCIPHRNTTKHHTSDSTSIQQARHPRREYLWGNGQAKTPDSTSSLSISRAHWSPRSCHLPRSLFEIPPGRRNVEVLITLKRRLITGGTVIYIVYVCMYDHTYSKSMHQPGKIISPARGQLNRKNEHFPFRVRSLYFGANKDHPTHRSALSTVFVGKCLALEQLQHNTPASFLFDITPNSIAEQRRNALSRNKRRCLMVHSGLSSIALDRCCTYICVLLLLREGVSFECSVIARKNEKWYRRF